MPTTTTPPERTKLEALRSRQDQVDVAPGHGGQHLVTIGGPDVGVEDLHLDVAGVPGVAHPTPDPVEIDVAVAHHAAGEQRIGRDGQPCFLSNHAGGILGGISTGQPVVCRFAVKPTSSILTPRRTIDREGVETDIVTKGRHDPCVGIRAVPIGEAMLAIVLADHFLRHRAQIG